MIKKKVKSKKDDVPFYTPQCPVCQSTDISQYDVIEARTPISLVHLDGTVEWFGETDVDWDTQKPLRTGDLKRVWICMSCENSGAPSLFLPKRMRRSIKG